MANHATSELLVLGDDKELGLFLDDIQGENLIPRSLDDLEQIVQKATAHDIMRIKSDSAKWRAIAEAEGYDFFPMYDEEINLWLCAFGLVRSQKGKGTLFTAYDECDINLAHIAFPSYIVLKNQVIKNDNTEWLFEEIGSRWWCCCGVGINDHQGKKLARIGISSAWSGITSAVQKMTEKYPLLEFCYTWCEQGMGVSGILCKNETGTYEVFGDDYDKMLDRIMKERFADGVYENSAPEDIPEPGLWPDDIHDHDIMQILYDDHTCGVFEDINLI